MKALLLATILPFFLISCSSTETQTKLKTYEYSNIHFSAQPNNDQIKTLKDQGFSTIINLRDPKEHNEALEKETSKDVGLNYYNIPFYKNSKLDDQYISKVTKAVMKHRKEGKILIHCSSGNRAALWVGGHFHKDHKFSKEKSVELAKSLGLTKKGALTKLEKYLEKK